MAILVGEYIIRFIANNILYCSEVRVLGEREDMLVQAGKQLRDLRTKTTKSVYKVAKAIHISGNYLSEIERGIKEPSDLVLESISNYYGIEKAELFSLYNRIAPTETSVLLNNPNFRKTITQVSMDDRLTDDDRALLYKEFHKLYESIADKKERK